MPFQCGSWGTVSLGSDPLTSALAGGSRHLSSLFTMPSCFLPVGRSSLPPLHTLLRASALLFSWRTGAGSFERRALGILRTLTLQVVWERRLPPVPNRSQKGHPCPQPPGVLQSAKHLGRVLAGEEQEGRLRQATWRPSLASFPALSGNSERRRILGRGAHNRCKWCFSWEFSNTIPLPEMKGNTPVSIIAWRK